MSKSRERSRGRNLDNRIFFLRAPVPFTLAALFLLACVRVAAQAPSAADYAAVQQIFNKQCLDCHAAQEPEGHLVLEDFQSLMKGGESGPAVAPGKSSESLLIKMLEGSVEKGVKKLIMPPGKRAKLGPEEIASIRSWIDAGAKAPLQGTLAAQEVVIPRITPTVAPKRSIHSLAYSAKQKLIAIGRYGEVELVSEEGRLPVRTLSGHRGDVNALAFSQDGAFLFAGAGDAGLQGEIRQWNVSNGTLVRAFEGHRDSVYAIALSPDGKVLASGSYDQKIRMWETESGKELKVLSGHNGAVFDLDFRPDGVILASASADRTVKLWDVSTGERRDTLSQSLKDLSALVFSADGKRLFAAGGDNRIRLWEISDQALETTNPLLEARFAHEGAILRLALSPDGKLLASSASDGTIRVWDAVLLKEKTLLEPQSDWVCALVFLGDNQTLVAGRLDGTLQYYNAETGKLSVLPKPELARTQPRGVQRGTTVKLKLLGAHLSGLTSLSVSDSRLKGELLPSDQHDGKEAWAALVVPPDMPSGGYDLWVRSGSGDSAKVKVHIDNLPQLELARAEEQTVRRSLDQLPVDVWSTHERPGENEVYSVHAAAGQQLVFDVAARSLGSKAGVVLTLSDADGKVLASSNGYDVGGDPFLAYQFASAGQYRLRVNELVLGASADHFYRLTVGNLPYVTGCFPLSVPAGRESEIQLIGYNLPVEKRTLKVHPEKAGEFQLAYDSESLRARRPLKVIASDQTELVESEPDDSPAQAAVIPIPCVVAGRLWGTNSSGDADVYRFKAKAGEKWVIETCAAQKGSLADTRLEVLHGDGRPLVRAQLQAVRDSAITFRGIDSDSSDCRVINWEEMELNQLLYLQGEVVKLFRAPQGPDSGFVFYTSHGKRRCLFDTSPAAHAVDEACYIVEAHRPDETIKANGLPTFPLYFENDDDGERELGTDSRLNFAAPADGEYLIRVTDTRGFSGEEYVYRLVVRRTEPDFSVALNGTGLTVNAGSGQPFSVHAERMDGFDGPITVSLDHLPKGFSTSTPLVIEAGHSDARGTLHAAADAPKPSAQDWAKVEVTASAQVDGRAFVKAVNAFGHVQLAEKPKLFVFLEPMPAGGTNSSALASQIASGNATGGQPLELTIAPGQTIPAMLRVERNGYDDLITFTVENLPHGIIVDNIGLNGVLIPKGQNERQIFITAAKWVPETDRLCYAVESQAGRQTSQPVLLHVRKTGSASLTQR